MPVIAVSPYHLTTREPPALAALQLATHVLTLMPTPPSARSGDRVDLARARDAASAAPGYLAMLDAWRWAMPLFREGILGSTHQGEDAADDVHRAWSRVYADDALAPLRGLMRDRLYDDDRAYLTALARDVLRAGPDPAVSIPVAAGLDAFAARHGLLVARPAPSSMVQRLEAGMATPAFTLTLPLLIQASGDRILEARELFHAPLVALRRAIDSALATRQPLPAFEAAELREAAADYTEAFEADRGTILGPGADDEEVRPVAALVALTAVTLPADAVLRASLRASRAINADADARPVALATPTMPPRDAVDPLMSLTVRVIG